MSVVIIFMMVKVMDKEVLMNKKLCWCWDNWTELFTAMCWVIVIFIVAYYAMGGKV